MKYNIDTEDAFKKLVTPCVGVWIEMPLHFRTSHNFSVTPCVGVWIEMDILTCICLRNVVTPCVGVWIEIELSTTIAFEFGSLPVWECGLKYLKLYQIL